MVPSATNYRVTLLDLAARPQEMIFKDVHFDLWGITCYSDNSDNEADSGWKPLEDRRQPVSYPWHRVWQVERVKA